MGWLRMQLFGEEIIATKLLLIMIGRRLVLAILLVAFWPLPFLALGQVKNSIPDNPRYGADPQTREECVKNTSYYSNDYKQNNFKAAEGPWAVVYTICPRSSENVYIRGIRMLKSRIADEKDPNTRTELVDSLMRIYDKRILHFKKEGSNLSQKGVDLHLLSPERSGEVYAILQRACALSGESFDPQAMLVLMQCTKDLYGEQKLPADSVMAMYARLSDVFAKQIVANPADEKLKPMSESLDALFTSAGVANCESLISIYTPKFEANPTDVELARSIYNQLAAMRCTDAELYLAVGTVLFNSSPTPALGNELARLYLARRKNSEADSFFKRAIAAETDSIRRSAMLVEYASFVGNNLGEMGRARSLAYEALEYNRKQGYAYFLIASLYAGTKNCGSSKMDNLSVYWAAVDKFNMAKSVEPSLESDCNKQIAYLAQFFPSKEEVFFQDLEVGKTYTVPCWINERTTIRARD